MTIERVRDWMTRDVITVTTGTRLTEAYQSMRQRGIRRLPVLEDGRVIGIVSSGDLRAKGIDTESEEVGKMRIDAVYTADPVTVAPDDLLKTAAERMLQGKFGGLPVLEDGKLVGIITESDLVRALVALLGARERATP
jgi:CBS domain-containing protein